MTLGNFGQIWGFFNTSSVFPSPYDRAAIYLVGKDYLLLGIFFVAKWGVLTWGYLKKFRSDLELFNYSSIPHISRVLTHTFN